MDLKRRQILAGTLALAACGSETPMYGLFGKFIAKPGQRDTLIQILLSGTGGMPGCRVYIVATDPADANAIWTTEVWDSEAEHDASLQLPHVRETIAQARPLIDGFGDERFVTTPVGGIGLDR